LDSALVCIRQAAEMDSANPLVSRLHAAILDRQGHPGQAIAALVHSLRLQGQGALAAAMQRAYGRSGLEGALDVLIAAYLRKRESGAYEPAEHVAELHARLGRKEEAFRWLEVAYREHDTELNRLYADPIFDPLRADPRFADLLRRLGFPAGSS